MKPIKFHGDSLERLKLLPEPVKKRAGYQLWLVQNGKDPVDWKSFSSVGKGVKEIRIRYKGQYRIIYIAKLRDAVHVLNVFQKKTGKTPRREIALARERLKEITDGKQRIP